MAGTALAAQVSAVRIGPETESTRIVIEADIALDASMFALAEQGLRLVLDMPRVEWAVPGEPVSDGQQRGPGGGLVAQYRFAHNSPETSRMVLDLAAPARVANRFLLSPGADSPRYRLVIDLEPTTMESFVAALGAPISPPISPSGAPAPIATAAVTDPPSAPADAIAAGASGATPAARITAGAPTHKPVIVIDAGHGGRDPGAIGATGQHEKVVNLAAAMALRDALEETGRYQVVLTRSTDIYLDLDRRVAIARENNADLFISLHADASANRETRGASIYTLSETGQARSQTTARRNNWRPQAANSVEPQVAEILTILQIRETKNQSSIFAEMLTGRLAGVSPMLRNSHREAGYFVLLAPDVPAVLLEMGFMSNRQDEANLTSASYRKTLMQSVGQAIDEYFHAQTMQYAGG